MYGLFKACHIPALRAIVGSFVNMLYDTIGLMIESVITCLCNNMCGCVDLMKC